MFRRIAVTALVILSSTSLLAQMSAGEFGFTMTSPYRSLPKTQRIINEFALDLRTQMGYDESDRPDVDWKTTDAAGVLYAKRFSKQLPDNTVRTLEVIVSRAASTDLMIRVVGATITAAGELPNPDLATLRGTLDLILRQQPPEPPQQPGLTPQNMGQYMYQLSYVQADRAIALLKALGYTTIEFTRQQGESNTESAFEPLRKGTAQLPAILKMIDAGKTSLMDPNPALSVPGAIPIPQIPQFGAITRQAVPDIGGTYLHQTTAGEPLQRLLILFDENDPESLERILSLLTEQIDVPARQVVISALIVEVNSDALRDLGITFRGSNGRVTTTFLQNPTTGDQLPFTFTYDETMPVGPFNITATIRALVDNGEAEILSNPSVLVLDGRQARIQVGQQVPVVNSTATAAGITQSVEYFPVGIVLNLRPRISDDGTEVTMQVETIVSAVGASQPTGTGSVFFAPTVDNRQVQTFVRVEDSTPFIIGGLISTDERDRRTGIPFLSQIPILGVLFRTNTVSKTKREVIVVLTPHVVPLEERSFSYVIPKDSDVFDSFGNKLFRNAYRIRSRDVYDLRFVYESDILRNVISRARTEVTARPMLSRTEPFGSLLRGEVPGEDILVRRMLWEIVRRSGFANQLEDERIIFFEPSPGDRASTDFVLSLFREKLEQVRGTNALVLSFDAESRGTPDHPFVQPKADVSWEKITRANFEKRLIELNSRSAEGRPQRWAIIISNEYSGSVHPLEVLKNVLVLKRLLALNNSLPLTIKDFHVGRQIIFPTEDDIQQGFHVIDRDAARLFYEVMQYYRAFEQEFNQQMQAVQRQLSAGASP